jgi:hypothetical protein
VVIALRYLLEAASFTQFFQKLAELIHSHPDNAIFPKTELIKSMGFPSNWQDAAMLPL